MAGDSSKTGRLVAYRLAIAAVCIAAACDSAVGPLGWVEGRYALVAIDGDPVGVPGVLANSVGALDLRADGTFSMRVGATSSYFTYAGNYRSSKGDIEMTVKSVSTTTDGVICQGCGHALIPPVIWRATFSRGLVTVLVGDGTYAFRR